MFENDLVGAACAADGQNAASLSGYGRMMQYVFPAAAFGSAAKVNSWLKRGGAMMQTKSRTENAATARDAGGANQVPTEDACPRCGEREAALLELLPAGRVRCSTCGSTAVRTGAL